MLTLNDGRSELWQWDTGRKLTVDADCSQVHFSNKVFGRSIDVNVADGMAIIPDILLQTDKELTAWAFVGTPENGYTKISKVFKVNKRNKPADYVFTPADQTTLEEIKEKIDYLESIQDPDAIKDAVEDYLEQNPVKAPVQSVNGKIGAVNLTAEDIGAISKDDLQGATNEALAQAKASGEFDGKDGIDGVDGKDGQDGQDGYTPVKGEDYFTQEDVQEIAEAAAELVEVPEPSGGGLTAEQITALDGMFKICAYTADATNAYKAFQTAFGIAAEEEPDAPDKTLTSISVVYSGGDVAVGTAVSDLTGIAVTAHYSDNTSETVTGYTMSGTIAEGNNTITVSYGGKTATFSVVGTAVVTTYTIAYELVNVKSSNRNSSVNEGASYTATLTADDGYTLEGATVTVTMGGVDITSTAYVNGAISIASVTGNVEIIASAVQVEETPAELNTDGLVFDFDLRNATMEEYNLSGWGKVYRTIDKTGNALLFGVNAATGDGIGLRDYDFRQNRMVSSETKKVGLGETYTVHALYKKPDDRRVQSNLFNWGQGKNVAGHFGIQPTYLVGTTENRIEHQQYMTAETDYIVATYVVNGPSLTIYHNSEIVRTEDGSAYDGFTKWVDYGTPNAVWNQGYVVAFVGYNRALTKREVIDNIAYFKTLEVV